MGRRKNRSFSSLDKYRTINNNNMNSKKRISLSMEKLIENESYVNSFLCRKGLASITGGNGSYAESTHIPKPQIPIPPIKKPHTHIEESSEIGEY